jgi:hypothetical protein
VGGRRRRAEDRTHVDRVVHHLHEHLDVHHDVDDHDHRASDDDHHPAAAATHDATDDDHHPVRSTGAGGRPIGVRPR